MKNEFVRLHAFVEGSVQGVGYRAFVAEWADALELNGWVRNTYSGEVEILAEGTQPFLDRLYTELLKGPRGSYVSGVRTEWLPASGEFVSFDIERTV
jgi:acylphosphatase